MFDAAVEDVSGAGTQPAGTLDMFTQQGLRGFEVVADAAGLLTAVAPGEHVGHRGGQALADQLEDAGLAQAAGTEQARRQAAGIAALLQAAPHIAGIAVEQGAAGREQGGVFHHLAQAAAMGGRQGDLPGMFPLDVDDPGAPVHVPQFQGKGLHQAQTAIAQEHEDAPQAGMGPACPHAGRFGVLLPVPGFGGQQFLIAQAFFVTQQAGSVLAHELLLQPFPVFRLQTVQ